jgi:hypothetical protein
MLIVYVFGFIHLITILIGFIGIDHNGMLTFPLLFSLIYIECKRDPDRDSYLYFFKVKSKNILI